jgi:anti-sigma28 factor (negative regulator of flagellin synthesis)
MQISEPNRSFTTATARAKAELQTTAPTQPAAQQVPERFDEASLGSVAKAVSQGLVASEARVAELRAQYQSGSYKVDAADLSSKLIDEHLEK